MIVICCGMYRSASTWQYNVASHLVENYHGGERLGYVADGSDLEARLGSRLRSGEWFAIKAHEPNPLYADLIADGNAVALYSYRDIRDVAYSIAHKRCSTFEREIDGTDLLSQTVRNFRFWTEVPRSLAQRYEAIMADSPSAVQQIASHLGLQLPNLVASEIASEYSLENNRARSERLAAELCARGVDLADPANALHHDAETQLHWNHIRDGSVGGWRGVATPRQLAVLAHGCGQWLIEQGYERDWAWAHPAIEYLLFQELPAQHLQLMELTGHLERHRESLATLHEHLSAARAEAAMLAEQLTAIRQELPLGSPLPLGADCDCSSAMCESL